MTLHVTNGDVVVDLLRRAGLADHTLAWADVLHEGPVPAGLADAGLRRARAEFLAGADGGDPAGALRRLTERDRALAGGRTGDYLLWFEADLYDQLQIAQILAMLGDLGVAPAQVTLVCIWRLLTMVRRGTVFSHAAFRYVDVVIGAAAAASLLTFGFAVTLARMNRSIQDDAVAPGFVLLICGAAVMAAGIALLVLVLRMLLAQAVARDAEAHHLQAELDEVI